MREAVIVSGARTAVGRSKRGALASARPDDLGAAVVAEAVRRVPGLKPEVIEDVILGCSAPEGEQGFNLGRIAAMLAGLPFSVPGQTVNRFCASGLQTIALAAQQIMAGMGQVIVAGGAESMSLLPMGGNKIALNLKIMDNCPDHYISMGLTAERVARECNVSREDQDAFALRSHQLAASAQDAGRFKAEIVPFEVEITQLDDASQLRHKKITFDKDEGPRRDTSLAALAALKPAFMARGTVTAGNSSQTSDGAAAVVIMDRQRAEAIGAKPLLRFVSFAVGGVRPEVMGIGPLVAVPKALALAGLTLKDIDLIELNEAFASQALAVIRGLGMDPDRVNVNGGAIALGHPLGCTGAKLTVQLMNELARRHARYGIVTMCVGGGQGAAAVFENLQ
jgi:acetyl-CoA acyltransferase